MPLVSAGNPFSASGFQKKVCGGVSLHPLTSFNCYSKQKQPLFIGAVSVRQVYQLGNRKAGKTSNETESATKECTNWGIGRPARLGRHCVRRGDASVPTGESEGRQDMPLREKAMPLSVPTGESEGRQDDRRSLRVSAMSVPTGESEGRIYRPQHNESHCINNSAQSPSQQNCSSRWTAHETQHFSAEHAFIVFIVALPCIFVGMFAFLLCKASAKHVESHTERTDTPTTTHGATPGRANQMREHK